MIYFMNRSPILEEHSYVCSPQTVSPANGVPERRNSDESSRSRSSSNAVCIYLF